MALGNTASMTPVWVRSVFVRASSLDRNSDAFAHFARRPDAVDAAQDAFALIIGDECCGHVIVGVEPLLDRLFSVIIAMHEVGGIGGRIILEVIDLSSPDICPAQDRSLHQ